MGNFNRYSSETLLPFVKPRLHETKLGEKVSTSIVSASRFALIGIPESIGVRANDGIAGTETAWESFLNAFLNIQTLPQLTGEEIVVYGAFDFSHLGKTNDFKILRNEVEEIDNAVSTVISEILRLGLCPIVIGGGHNNAFPIIRAVSQFLQKPLGVLNFDAHSDYRPTEGRHSGNGFRYAFSKKLLKKYTVIGLHENYNSSQTLRTLQTDGHQYFTFEEIFIHQKIRLEDAISEALNNLKEYPIGLEIDADVMENVLSSAASPCGFSATQLRQSLFQVLSSRKPHYFHLCEAAPKLSTGQTNVATGKLLSYIVSDFMKAFGIKLI
jgi:formiminoglutamase